MRIEIITLGSLSIAPATKTIILEPVDKHILDTSLLNCKHVFSQTRKANYRKVTNLKFFLCPHCLHWCLSLAKFREARIYSASERKHKYLQQLHLCNGIQRRCQTN